MTDLDKLIEAVEGGWWYGDTTSMFEHSLHISAYKAFNGSLDAAKSLHEALISSCQANIELSGEVWVLGDETDWKYIEAKVYGNPARAWLLAILKAYRSLQ